MTRIVAISDTHSQLDKIDLPEGDILISAGDITYRGTLAEMTKQLDILQEKGSKFKSTILVLGNHDFLGQDMPYLTRIMCEERKIIWLQGTGVTIDGINFYGDATTPEFFDWAFMKKRGEEIAQVWKNIPDDTNVLITHGPAEGFRDLLKDGVTHVGCEELSNRIIELNYLRLHCFGHIHYSYGTEVVGNTTFINASICTEAYKPTNPPIVFDYIK